MQLPLGLGSTMLPAASATDTPDFLGRLLSRSAQAHPGDRISPRSALIELRQRADGLMVQVGSRSAMKPNSAGLTWAKPSDLKASRSSSVMALPYTSITLTAGSWLYSP